MSVAAMTAVLTLVAAGARAQALPPPPSSTESPWDGDWVLSQTRNTPEIKAAAAAGYRFHVQSDGSLRWEIPALQEIVQGSTNGQPMAIHRPHPTALTLSVTAEGPYVLTYEVRRAGHPEGQGRMTLVEQGRAWVDISQPAGRPDLAGAIVYVRPDAANR
jgi:hypothetical protein